MGKIIESALPDSSVRVRDVMKAVTVVAPDAPIAEAAQVMKEEGGNVVRVGSEQNIQGVVSARDIALAGSQRRIPRPCQSTRSFRT